MQAVILAGGKGVRLKPYTVSLPKPLVPVGEEPILKILLQNLRRQGVREATICVNHMADLIEAYFGDGSKFGISVQYTHEQQPLGTAAPIKLIKTLPDDFLVMNGDLLTDISFKQLYWQHKHNDAIMTIATHTQKIKVDYGVIKPGPDHTAESFVEKPTYDINVCMGIYALNKRALDYIPDGTRFGFDDLVKALLAKGETVRTFPHTGYWLDIGRPEEYEQANNDCRQLLSDNQAN